MGEEEGGPTELVHDSRSRRSGPTHVCRKRKLCAFRPLYKPSGGGGISKLQRSHLISRVINGMPRSLGLRLRAFRSCRGIAVYCEG